MRTIPDELDKITATIGKIKERVESQPSPDVLAQIPDRLAALEASVRELAARPSGGVDPALAGQIEALTEAVGKLAALAVDQDFVDQARTAFQVISKFADKAPETPTDVTPATEG